MKGFSRANLMYMRAFAEAWPDRRIVQQLVGQLSWGANLVLLTRLKDASSRRNYALYALEHGWSRNVLQINIERGMVERTGKATTNFASRLPASHSSLAVQVLKDPYLFDFLGVGAEADERAIEEALVAHITRFLLELGAGFAFVGRQVHLEVGGEDFFIDLSCSCPDWASMCKHVAAVLYGIGARLDERPELLFKLRKVDEKELIAKAGRGLPLAKKGPAADKVLESEGLSELFGLEMDASIVLPDGRPTQQGDVLRSRSVKSGSQKTKVPSNRGGSRSTAKSARGRARARVTKPRGSVSVR